MNVLLTGATGFLGSEIARRLVAAGHNVRVLVRKTSRLDGLAGLPVEKAEGDILDKASILRALDGIDGVIHTAASVSFRRRDKDLVFRANVEGTRNVLGAALEKGVKRAVHTSSIAAVGTSDEPTLLDESSKWDIEWFESDYMTSKRQAEDVALGFAKQGLSVVVVNPGSILGPGDVYISSTKLVREFLEGRLPVYIQGGSSFCDVREVAKAHVAALERGRAGERYILAGQNFTYGEFYEIVSRQAGVRMPRRISKALAYTVAFLSEMAAKLFTHSLEEMNRPVVRVGTRFNYMDVRKAQKELGYVVPPIEETIRDTISDHLRRGLIAARTPELQKLKEAASVPVPVPEPEPVAA